VTLKLLVGLGNPGPKYEYTRHNAGFWLLDELAREANTAWDNAVNEKFQAVVGKGNLEGESCVFLKPMTFMNLSGRSVQKVAQFYKIEASNWIVLHDDIDLAQAVVKARVGGGHGGHNGIRSIIEVTGRDDFKRIKLGVGRPEKLEDGRPLMDVADFVLKAMPLDQVAAYVQAVKPNVLLRLKDLLKQSK